MSTTQPKTEKKQIKHTFTREEREKLSQDLVEQLARQSGIEMELKQVKSNFTAKLDEAAAQIGLFTQNLQSGFEYRMIDCRVEFRPKDKKKDFFRVDTGEWVAEENMSQEDFQYNLMLEDAKFEAREELDLFKAGSDKGVLVIAKASGKWVAAIRANLGVNSLSERLNSTKGSKLRIDAIRTGLGRLEEWIESVSPGSGEGFRKKFDAIIEAQKEKVE